MLYRFNMSKRKGIGSFYSQFQPVGPRRRRNAPFRAPRPYIPRRRRAFVPGRDRTAGFYGRYSGTQPEKKFHDIDIDDAVVAINGTIAQVSCNVIAEGNGESNRIGRRVTVKNINWRFQVTLPTTAVAADTSDVVRVILYLDKQCNGATAVASTDAGILATDDFQSFNNLANSKRFRILMDRTYDLVSKAGSGRGSTDTLSYADDVISDTFFKKCNIPIEYDNSATDGTITTIRTNNIGVLLLGRNGKAGFASKMRLRYSDV